MDRDEAQDQGARDAAMVLPFVAMLLLMPPLVLIFTAPLHVAGIPLIVLYIFGVWGAVILGAFLTARRLASLREEAGDLEPPDTGDRL